MASSEDAHIELGDLPEELRSPLNPHWGRTGDERPLYQVEREPILASVHKNGGNRTRTAKELEIGSATPYRKLESYRTGPPGA